MKHLFAALAICVATNTQQAEPVFAPLLEETSKPEIIEEFIPDFSIITIDHAREYIQTIYPYAVKVQKEQSIPAPITLAIACLETGYGRSFNAKEKHNHLGIRVYQNGKAGYRRFSSLDECFDYYTGMFNMARYAPLQDIEANDLPAFIKGLQECGFNHRDKYSKMLATMIDFLHLEELEYPMV
ncbi:glucosaminidase domain-containing protein [Aureispira anguillae]|uniref:Glucosaminidase domain-containing protein n=1 Tax=Aureispira anguillae TaxID=2864201 RepID=A0A915YB55_9BACT|nr:glucosaminidase domain-containing protein [Aureispira anguillae]BDS09841.1 glucosaminidase domain-containing protein [Aureispira anguillae]